MTPAFQLLLAAAAKTNAAATNAAAQGMENVTKVKTSLADWVVQGGIMMVPILLASIVAMAIIFERFLYLRKVRLDTEKFMDKIKRVLGANRIMEALAICENTMGPIPNLVKAGIEKHGHEKEDIREAIEESSTKELPKLERFLPALGTIANVSPLLGLLGTVIGMIKSSDVMATAGTSNPLGLIGGISEALITTAAGLFVAIPVLIFYNYFVNRVNSLILEMEIRSTELVSLLTDKSKKTLSKEDWEKI